MVLSSPQKRAFQTASILAAGLGLPLETDERLKEVHNGRLAGLDQQQMAQDFPVRSDHASRFNPIGETGEDWWAFNLRAGETLQSLIDLEPGNYLVVSHGAFLNYLLFNILNMHAVPGRVPLFHLENTGYARAAFSPQDNYWQILRSGAAPHLNQGE
jgi:broad specificity phosphatase PhoE